MKIMGTDFDVRIKRDGSVEQNITTESFGKWEVIDSTSTNYSVIVNALNEFRTVGATDISKLETICGWKTAPKHRTRRTKAEIYGGVEKAVTKATATAEATATATEEATAELLERKRVNKETLSRVFCNIQRFFAEFQFSPSIRLFDTFLRCKTSTDKQNYLHNYFALMDNPSTEALTTKFSSPEFKAILSDAKSVDFSLMKPKTNNRLSIYFGSQGCGKTYTASKVAKVVITCHSGIDPDSLMTEFDFDSGKPTFKKSAFFNCIESGGEILLDEMSILPMDTLRFLQNITDGKRAFNYKGSEVTIADDFHIIGTMNLFVNGVAFPLPEPLIDRADELREFTLNGDFVADALSI